LVEDGATIKPHHPMRQYPGAVAMLGKCRGDCDAGISWATSFGTQLFERTTAVEYTAVRGRAHYQFVFRKQENLAPSVLVPETFISWRLIIASWKSDIDFLIIDSSPIIMVSVASHVVASITLSRNTPRRCSTIVSDSVLPDRDSPARQSPIYPPPA